MFGYFLNIIKTTWVNNMRYQLCNYVILKTTTTTTAKKKQLKKKYEIPTKYLQLNSPSLLHKNICNIMYKYEILIHVMTAAAAHNTSIHTLLTRPNNN